MFPLPSFRLGLTPIAVVTASLAAVTMAHPAQAQSGNFTVGGDARAFAMGGAGVAVSVENSGNRLNPASLSFESGNFGYHAPSFGFRANNFDANVATSFLAGGSKSADASSLVRKYASDTVDQNADFGVNANASFRIGKFEVGGFGVGKANLLPNDTLKAWAKTNGNIDDLAVNPAYQSSRLDLIGAGYYTLPAVLMASTLPVKNSTVYNYGVGVRLKAMTAFYTHYVADSAALSGVTVDGVASEAVQASEMNGSNYLKKSGFGADLGFLAKPRHNEGVSYALVAANLINPNFKFNGTDRNGNPTVYDILKTTYTSGIGYQKKATILVADWVDMTGATGPAQFRAGIEQRMLGNKIALRGGYNSATGYTYGLGFFGFDMAFGSKAPLEVLKTLNF